MSAQKNWLDKKIVWQSTRNAQFPYRSAIDGQKLLIRCNDFPDEDLYTLIVDGQEIIDFNNWPNSWMKK